MATAIAVLVKVFMTNSFSRCVAPKSVLGGAVDVRCKGVCLNLI
jgi:hypothetical protein